MAFSVQFTIRHERNDQIRNGLENNMYRGQNKASLETIQCKRINIKTNKGQDMFPLKFIAYCTSERFMWGKVFSAY